MQSLKAKFKRILAYILAILTLVTSVGVENIIPTTEALASDTVGNNTGGGTAQMGYTNDYKAWNKNRSGYRFYIINSNLERVSNILDITFQEPTQVSKWCLTTRFDTDKSPDESTYYSYTIKDQYLKDLLGQATQGSETKAMIEWMPVPTTSSAGQGEQFKNWFMFNSMYDNSTGTGTWVQGSDNSYDWGSGADDTNAVQQGAGTGSSLITPDGDGENYVLNHDCLSTKCINKGNGMYAEADKNMGTGLILEGNKLIAAVYSIGNAKGIKTTFNNMVRKYWKHKAKNPLESNSVVEARMYALGKCYYTYTNIPTKYRAYVISNIANGLSSYRPDDIPAIITSGLGAPIAQAPTDDILSTQIPLQKETAEKISPVNKLLENEKLLKVEGYTSTSLALLEDHYLIVEPIVWLYVATSAYSYSPYGHRTYGSYWNIIQEWKGTDSGGFYASYLKKLGNNCMIVEEDVVTPTGKVIKGATIENRTVSTTKSLMAQGYGLSMHLYSKALLVEADTSTCDEGLNNTPGPAPDDSSKLEGMPDNPYDPKHEGKEFPYANIVKFYELYEDDKLLYTNSFTRTPTPKEISIEDEGIFRVVDWYTSETFKEATGEEPRYNEYKKQMQNDIVQKGTSPDVVTLNTESTLYVKLIAEQETTYKQATGTWTLSESRMTKIASTNADLFKGKGITVNFDKLDSVHTNCYEYKCSKNAKDSKECKAHCNKDSSNLCHWKETYWYCIDCEHICAKQSPKCTSCSGKHTREKANGKNGKPYEWYWKHECDGHQTNSSMDFGDNQILIKVYADDIDVSLRGYDTVMNTPTVSYTRAGQGEQSNRLVTGTYKETFLVHRGGYDLPQQYLGVVRTGASPVSSTTAHSGLASLGFEATLTSPISRTVGALTKTLNLTYHIDKAGSDLETYTECKYTCTECKLKHKSSCDHKTIDTIDDNQRTEAFTTSGSVAINTYAGKLSGGVIDISYNTQATMSPSVDGFGVASGTMVQQSSKQFLFYPFIQMQYDTMSAQNQKINITGIWQRGMQVNDYAEVAWNSNTKENNIHVTSNQWSTHAKALELAKSLGSTLKNVILPGGAIYSLDTKDSNQKVQVATYQTILIDEGLQQAEYTSKVSDDLKHNTAINEHKDFVGQVKSNLESLNLEQYVSTKATDKNAWQNGKKVYNGSDISYLKNGSSTASEDDKYYLKNDNYGLSGLANEADLDVKELSTSYSYYTFYSTVEGDIYMVKAENVAQGSYPTGKGTKILSKNEDASKLSSSGDENIAKKINTRTLVVDKLVKSVERNTGNDKSASWASSDGHWYNEAFNGVTVVVQKTQLEVGLTSPTVRTTILDPRLIPQQSSKGTIFTKAYLSQYKTSNTPAGTGKPNVIGTFKGRDITLANLDMLFYSNKFYIPDATVQDLS